MYSPRYGGQKFKSAPIKMWYYFSLYQNANVMCYFDTLNIYIKKCRQTFKLM